VRGRRRQLRLVRRARPDGHACASPPAAAARRAAAQRPARVHAQGAVCAREEGGHRGREARDEADGDAGPRGWVVGLVVGGLLCRGVGDACYSLSQPAYINFDPHSPPTPNQPHPPQTNKQPGAIARASPRCVPRSRPAAPSPPPAPASRSARSAAGTRTRARASPPARGRRRGRSGSTPQRSPTRASAAPRPTTAPPASPRGTWRSTRGCLPRCSSAT
jgi:hypothetical protein